MVCSATRGRLCGFAAAGGISTSTGFGQVGLRIVAGRSTGRRGSRPLWGLSSAPSTSGFIRNVWAYTSSGLLYVELFGKPSRIDLLNRASSPFFGMVQRVLWRDVLLHLARLTDPAKTGRYETSRSRSSRACRRRYPPRPHGADRRIDGDPTGAAGPAEPRSATSPP